MLRSNNINVDVIVSAKDMASGNLNKVTASTGSLTSSILKANIAFSAIEKGVGFAIGSIKKLGMTIIGTYSNSLQMADSLEQVKLALDTMLDPAENAGKLLEDLSEFARKTPFNLTDLQKYTKQLVAYNFSAKEIIPTLTSLGNVAAGVGTDKLPNIVYALGQIRVAGKLWGQDLRQLLNAGVPILGELAKVHGVTKDKVKDMVAESLISYEDVIKAFKNMSAEGGKFGGLMDKQSATFGGFKSNLEDFRDSMLRTIGGISESGEILKGGLLDKAKEGFSQLMSFLDENSEGVNKFGESLSKIGGRVIGFVTEIVKAIMSSDKVKEVFKELQKAGSELFKVLGDLFGGFNDIEDAGASAGETFAIKVVKGITAVIKGITELIKWLEENKETIMENIITIGKFLGAIIKLVGGIIGFIDTVGKKWGDFWYNFGIALFGAKEAVRKALNGVISIINDGISAVNTLIDKIRAIPVVGKSMPNISIPTITPLAEGGIVTKPTLSVIGEEGPEAVIPLNKAGGMGVNVNIYGDVYGIEDLTNKIKNSLQKQAKSQSMSTTEFLDYNYG